MRISGNDGRIHASERFGLRRLRFEQTVNAPEGALPWLAVINGRRTFLAGVNWVPPRADASQIDDAMTSRLLDLYASIGFNLVRVWGGANRPPRSFYRKCDERGLLVWQDLPLSSSGLDNMPSSSASFVKALGSIAKKWAADLCRHPCLALWCGGNELSLIDEDGGPGTPLDFDHPVLRAIRDGIRQVDPNAHIVPTSPSGPTYIADPERFGFGEHHDVHGPWTAPVNARSWASYWRSDDALFRSEVGVAGASSLDILLETGVVRNVDDGLVADLDAFRHASAWWLDGVEEEIACHGVETWITTSRQRQADHLALAMRQSLKRFPGCGGFVAWLGHDTFPCPVSLSIVDFHGRPKPAARAIAEVLAQWRDRSDFDHEDATISSPA